MERDDVKKMVGYMMGAYPGYYSRLQSSAVENQINVWTDIFKDYPVRDVAVGLKAYISAVPGGFPPSPGDIIEFMNRGKNPGNRAAIEAWNLVRKAVNRPRDQLQAAFDILPEPVKIVVGSPDTLMAWGNVNIEEFETVIQSNFLRSYDATIKRLAIDQKLPEVMRVAAKEAKAQRLTGPRQVEYSEVFDSTEVRKAPETEKALAALRERLGK